MSRKLDVIEPLAHDVEKEKVAEILSKAFSLSDTTMDADIKRMIEAKKPGIFSFQWKMTELQKEAEKKTSGSKTS
jgi:uncharacterized tellurite resistance protein B-like protein